MPGGTKAWALPRTPWGHPDLQGIWNNGTPTPLERSESFSGQEFLSEKEWAAIAEEVGTRADRRPANAAADVALAYNNEWYDRGAPLKRTSPPDGSFSRPGYASTSTSPATRLPTCFSIRCQ